MWRIAYTPTLETRTVRYAARRDGPWSRTPIAGPSETPPVASSAEHDPSQAPDAKPALPSVDSALQRIAAITILEDRDEAGRLRRSDGRDHPALLGGLKGLILRFNDADGTPVFQLPDRSPAVLSPDGRWVAAAFSPVPPPRLRGVPFLPPPDTSWRVWVWPLDGGSP